MDCFWMPRLILLDLVVMLVPEVMIYFRLFYYHMCDPFGWWLIYENIAFFLQSYSIHFVRISIISAFFSVYL